MIFVDFGQERGGKLASKSDRKSMLTSNGDFEIQWVEIGSNNRSKINIRSDGETERLGTPILIVF